MAILPLSKQVASMPHRTRRPSQGPLHVLSSYTGLRGRSLKATSRSEIFFLPAGLVEAPSLSYRSRSHQGEHTHQRSLDSKLKQGHGAAGGLVGFSTKTLPGTRSGHRQPNTHTGLRTIQQCPQLWMRQQQDTPNTAKMDRSDDILCVCLQTAHKSLNVLWKYFPTRK